MNPQHVVIIVGGATAGSEAAAQLTRRGIRCIVIEQNERPYGKIEDGLPRWHVHLRRQEMGKIDQKLDHPEVHFVPQTRLGIDLALSDLLAQESSAVVLAVGAWRDRPLPLPGIDAYLGRGFAYQNPFVYWFNHYPEANYQGPQFEVADGALVVGGGLASLDVVKVLMLETVSRALTERGQDADLYDLERRGIAAVLAERELSLADLGLTGCTLVYRRRVEDMPVAEPPEGATPEQVERVRATRLKMLQKFSTKYLFQIQDRHVPVGFLVDGDRLGGLRLAETELQEGRSVTLTGTERDFPSRLVVSSIGSIPEPISGLPMRGEIYPVKDARTGELEGLPGVFAIGNAVTGKGNIAASLRHGRVVSEHMLENYLMGLSSGYEETLAQATDKAQSGAAAVAERLVGRDPLPADRVSRLVEWAQSLQRRVAYPGSYSAYVSELPRV